MRKTRIAHEENTASLPEQPERDPWSTMPPMKPKANTSKEMKRDRRAPAARSKTMEPKEGSFPPPPEARADTAPDPRVPSSYPRRILLAVTGLSPQVVTETLYALAVEPPAGEERFVPTEVHLV